MDDEICIELDTNEMTAVSAFALVERRMKLRKKDDKFELCGSFDSMYYMSALLTGDLDERKTVTRKIDNILKVVEADRKLLRNAKS
jgi:hypothetical protein